MTKKYAEEIKSRAVELYMSGLPAIQVAEVIGANEATIRGWLKSRGIELKNGSYYVTKYSDEIINEAIKMYNDGFYTTEIDNALGLKRGIAASLLKRKGIELRHRGPKSKIKKEDFFDKIDTEEKAYFLGWLMADGNISINEGQYSLKIHIAIKDRELIDKFLLCIGSDNKTKIKEGKNTSYYVSLSSVHMCKSLMNLGMLPRKSGKETFPQVIPKEVYRHFMRGVFDGDGITDISRNRSGFVGSKEMLNTILKLLNDSDRKIIQNKKNLSIYYFLGGKKFSKKLYSYLYNDANIWLNRKRERLEKICFE